MLKWVEDFVAVGVVIETIVVVEVVEVVIVALMVEQVW